MTDKTIRSGSLQFWPRKRAKKFLPSVNWKFLCSKTDKKGLLGFIGYKVGMSSAFVKDSTENSISKNKNIILPCTIIEIPPVKILSVRFYKNNQLVHEILSDFLEKELKKKIKIPKNKKNVDFEIKKDYDDIRAIIYSQVKKTAVKKTPDIIEVGVGGSLDEKKAWIKENLGKEIDSVDFLAQGLVDVRGLTKGKGVQGPVKRFGISLRQHKSEKGYRRPGSIGPWHPARVTFRVPMAGQLGMFTRISYNKKIIFSGKTQEKNINNKQGFRKFGNVKTSYIIIQGSVQGSRKRQVLLTVPLRKTKKQEKKNYEFIELR
jgi:large subunit ribosomal protein L3